VFKIPFIRIILKPLSLKDKLLSGATLPRFFKMKFVGMSETFVCVMSFNFFIYFTELKNATRTVKDHRYNLPKLHSSFPSTRQYFD
jgi:hypothetical protein